jgi:mono/diheme cytochrome c family protein
LRLPALTVVAAGLLLLPALGFSQSSAQTAPMFSKDVMPILQSHCQACHRPGEIAPMSLMTFDEVRPWAKAIRENVIKRSMPPWHADPTIGQFSNDRRLSDQEIQTIARWVDAGAPQGNPADLPAPRKFVDGWSIGQPDVVLSMSEEYKVSAKGSDEYIYFSIPTRFTEDKYISAIEVRPGNRRVVHHVIAYAQKAGGGVPTRGPDNANRIAGGNHFESEGFAIWVAENAPVQNDECSSPNTFDVRTGDLTAGARPMICGYVPGESAKIMPQAIAQKIAAGSEILLQIHYAKTGKEEVDRTSVGIVFAKEPPAKIMQSRWVMNHYFQIPPKAANHEVKGCYTFDKDVDVLSFAPHMHLRGKDMEFKAHYPDGHSEVLFRTPAYDFNWQTVYWVKSQVHIPRGTRIEVTAHYDNSKGNRANPDPDAAVRWGDPTYYEMMIGAINFIPSDALKP